LTGLDFLKHSAENGKRQKLEEINGKRLKKEMIRDKGLIIKIHGPAQK
jgi:hypothetical protein